MYMYHMRKLCVHTVYVCFNRVSAPLEEYWAEPIVEAESEVMYVHSPLSYMWQNDSGVVYATGD